MSTWADSPGFPNFFARWIATPKTVKTSDLGTTETRIFTRVINSYEGSYPVGSVTYARVPKKKTALAPGARDPFGPDVVAAEMAKALNFTSWHERTQKNAKVYEQYWKEQGRIVRVYIVNEKDYFTVSVASWRVLYGQSIAIETELLQRELTHTLDAEIPWLDDATASLDFAFGTAAYADGCPPCGPDPFSQLACASCQAGQLAGPLGNLNNTINNVNQNIPGLTGAINNGAGAVNGATAAINNATGTAQNIANQYQGSIDQANKNWAETNKQAARAIDLGNKLANPFNDFLAGVGAGAGVAVGGLLVSAAVSGLTALGGAIVEFFTHEKADALKVSDFKEMMQKYNTVQGTLHEMETKINSSLTIMHMAEHANISCSNTPPRPDPHPEDEDYCKNQCAPPGHCLPECVPSLPMCPPACNPPLSGGAKVVGLECLIMVVSNKVEAEKTNYAISSKILEGAGSAFSEGCRIEMNSDKAKIEGMLQQDQKLLDTLRKSSKDDLCEGSKKIIGGLISTERDIVNPAATLTSEEYRRAWRDTQYKEDDDAQKRSQHSVSDADHQMDVDQSRALDAYRSDMTLLDTRFADGPYQKQYKEYREWQADQVSHCATHSESWDDTDPKHQSLVCDHGDCHHQQVTSGGAFYCGIPIIGLPACIAQYHRCSAHHQHDEAPAKLQGAWWPEYHRAIKDSTEAYWVTFRQSKINHEASVKANLKNITSRATQAEGRAANDKWLNDLMGEQTLENQTARRHELTDKEQEIAAACASKW